MLRGYKAEHYYPVYIGDVYHKRYKVVGKLGYGSASTVWLCRDTRTPGTYVALKVYINSSKWHRELPIYEHINSLGLGHDGRSYIRDMLDSFEIVGPHGKHICLVHQALGKNLEELRDLVPDRVYEPDPVRHTLRNILRAMHFLHETACVIHTDIQPKNILLGVIDKSAFTRFERDEIENPMPRKEVPGRTIYCSRPMRITKGTPSLCDFSEARFIGPHNSGRIMPDVYRAPEVILDLPWGCAVDVWAFGMTLWDLFEPKRLVSPQGEDGQYSEQHHLAQLTALLGPPPPEFLKRSKKSQIFWDSDGQSCIIRDVVVIVLIGITGNWRGSIRIESNDLESAEQRLHGEEKKLFLLFMRKMLQWLPEQRQPAQDVFMDEWPLADLIQSGHVVRD